MSQTSPLTPAWVSEFFDLYYGEFGLTWTEADQLHVAQRLAFILNLKPGHMVFDQCCGKGGLGWGFARLGIESIGVDLSQSYIQEAIERHPNTTVRASFYQGDAFLFEPHPQVDAAVNWHSSFGYAGMEGAIQLILQLRKKLKLGQRWLLELPNLAYLKEHFKPLYTQPLTGAHEGLHLIRHSAWNQGWLEQDWRVMEGEECVWKQTDTRCWCFSIDEIKRLIDQVQDHLVGFYGNLDLEPLQDSHPRMIVVVEKRSK